MGTPNLTEIGFDHYEKSSEDMQIQYLKIYNKIRHTIKHNQDWLLQLLCQYDSRAGMSLGDFMWYPHLLRMINEGSLYLKLMPIDNWAFADELFKDNCSNISDNYNIEVIKTDTTADANFSVSGELTFYKVYLNEELTPETPDEITVSNLCGYVEFGSTSLCKSIFTIMAHKTILRVPYKMSSFNINPVMAIFYNTAHEASYNF